MSALFLQIQESDNVLVALSSLAAGTQLSFQDKTIVLQDSIPAKHKIFINDMQVGDAVYMYGVVVGKLTVAVQSGMLMTTPIRFMQQNLMPIRR